MATDAFQIVRPQLLQNVVSFKSAWRTSQIHTVRLLGRTALGLALACLLELARPPESLVLLD